MADPDPDDHRGRLADDTEHVRLSFPDVQGHEPDPALAYTRSTSFG